MDKGKAKMPEYEDQVDNESLHSLDIELEGVDTPIQKNDAKKAIIRHRQRETPSLHQREKPRQPFRLRLVYGFPLCLHDEGGDSPRTGNLFRGSQGSMMDRR